MLEQTFGSLIMIVIASVNFSSLASSSVYLHLVKVWAAIPFNPCPTLIERLDDVIW
jgi:hypothetical protein